MQAVQPIRVLIVDDQELVRAGFAMVIDSQSDMHVIGQAGEGSQAVELACSLHPDVVLMDVRMPGMDGIEATRQISAMETQPGDGGAADAARDGDDAVAPRTTRVIILTTFDLDEYVMSAIHAGASGFLLKDTEPETLLASIRTVDQGNAIIAPSATRRLIESMLEHDGTTGTGGTTPHTAPPSFGAAMAGAPWSPDAAMTQPSGSAANRTTPPEPDTAPYTDPELDELTTREREVLIEIAHGLSNQEIADKLFISLPTVKTHVAHILAKINARDRVQAVVFAYENRLV